MRLCFFFIFASYKVTQLVNRCTLVFSISVNEVEKLACKYALVFRPLNPLHPGDLVR